MNVCDYVGSSLEAALSGYEYIASRNRVIHAPSRAEGFRAISLGLVKDRGSSRIKVTAVAQVRIERITSLYAPGLPWIKAADRDWQPTVARNCDNIHKDTGLVLSFPNNETELHRFTDGFVSAVKEKVVPWLDWFSDAEHIWENLVDDNRFNWIIPTEVMRQVVRIAICIDRKDCEMAATLCNELAAFGATVSTAQFAEAADYMRRKVDKAR